MPKIKMADGEMRPIDRRLQRAVTVATCGTGMEASLLVNSEMILVLKFDRDPAQIRRSLGQGHQGGFYSKSNQSIRLSHMRFLAEESICGHEKRTYVTYFGLWVSCLSHSAPFPSDGTLSSYEQGIRTWILRVNVGSLKEESRLI